MSYNAFCKRMSAVAKRVGTNVSFSHEDGKHIARFGEGVTVIGNGLCPSVSVNWGSGHTAIARI